MEGEEIGIFNQGTLNSNAGPDFSNARIKIGAIDWIGSVEIHTQSSEWNHHHHEQDKAYDNVILHLVWQHDRAIQRTDKTFLPTLELRGRVQESLIYTYRKLVNSAFSIPCRRSLPGIDELIKLSMMEKALMSRLERKADEVKALYRQNENNWEETFYQLLSRNFGFKINAEPFFQLAKSLPLKTLLKQGDKLDQIEALLFGQAGFLEGAKGDEYYLKLKREHRLLTQKYSLQQSKMSKAQWRFLRLRPGNFPSLRLAQLGGIIHYRKNLFSSVLHCDDLKSLVELFTVNPSEYWLGHYQFTKKSKSEWHTLGQASILSVIINTVVPVWVAYGKMMDEHRYVDQAIKILQQIPAEENKITKTWKEAGISTQSSFDSQALIELFNNFCQKKNCLNCNIGACLVRPPK